MTYKFFFQNSKDLANIVSLLHPKIGPFPGRFRNVTSPLPEIRLCSPKNYIDTTFISTLQIKLSKDDSLV